MFLAKASQVVRCPSCMTCRLANITIRRVSTSWTLFKNNKGIVSKVIASKDGYKKYETTSHSHSASLLAQKRVKQSTDQNILQSLDSGRVNREDLQSRLENLLFEWDGNTYSSSAHSLIDETFELDGDGNEDKTIESIILPSDFERNIKASPILGTEDRDIPPSDIPCVGCGAPFQCQHNTFPGFIPSEYFKSLSEREMKTSICQRCYYIRHCDAFRDVLTDPEEYKSLIAKIGPTHSVILLVVDVMDMGGSIVPNLMNYIGKNHPLVVVGNKADLLSPDCPEYLSHVSEMLRSACHSAGLSNIHKVTLASAKTGFGIERLISLLFAFYKQRVDLYIVGTANAGKSSLFNSLLASDYCKSSARDLIERATVSVWPGTTLNLLKFPIMRPSHRVHALRLNRLKQEQAQKKMQRRLERTRKKNTIIAPWELKEDVHITDTRKDHAKDLDEKGAAWGQEISGYFFRSDGRLEQEKQQPAPDTYDADRYDQSYWAYDTPGVINPNQVIHLLTANEMRLLTPTTMIVPRCLVLKPQETLFVSGLCRIDLKEVSCMNNKLEQEEEERKVHNQRGNEILFLAVHSGPNIPIHVVPTREADDFYETHIGTEVLGVPIGDKERLSKLPSLVAKNLKVYGEDEKVAVADIQLSSLGWISVALKKDLCGTLQVFSPGRRGLALRKPALMPHYLQFKGKKIRGSSFYHTKTPGWVMSRSKKFGR